MKKNKVRRIPLSVKVILIVFAVAILAGGGLFAKVQYEKGIMEPIKTGEVVPGVYAADNGFVNSFLLKRGDGYIMIDAGNDIEETKSALAELHIKPEDIRAIVLTHSDSDHIAAVSQFRSAQVYLPEQEVQMVNGSTRRSPLGYNNLETEYKTLKGGVSTKIMGYMVECISTPGHTPGSMSYIIDEKYLFVGDTMSLKDGKAELFNSFFNMDDDTEKRSIEKLAAMKLPKYLFTAHYGYSDDATAALKEWK